MAITQIGRYEIKHELGRGGMATVYLAHDPRFARDVAIKILPAQFTHDPQFKGRFEREARTIAALEHIAIVPVYDYGEEGDLPYIVMRYMGGGSLADRIGKGPMSLEEIQRIFSRLAPALDMAHKQGIVHRDLKPGNILFDSNGEPYLSDFGIAKLSESTSTFTGSGLIGTPAYMSPEQGRGDKDIDHRSDIYALGVILYQLLSGNMPFDADTPMGIVMRHIMDPVPEIEGLRAESPAGVNTVIQTAMAKDKTARYQSAASLSRALNELAPENETADSPTELNLTPTDDHEPATELDLPLKESAVTEQNLADDKEAVTELELDSPIRAAPRSPRPGRAPRSAGNKQPTRPAWLPWAGLAGILAVLAVGGYFAIGRRNTPAANEPPTQPAATAVNEVEGTPTCTDDIGCLTVARGEPIHLAYILSLSGGTATMGEDSLGGIQLALEQRGRVLNREVVLTGADGGCNATGGSAAAEEILSDPGVAAIVGTSCSGEALTALPAISDAGLTMCSPSNTLPALTNPSQSWKPGYFRAATNDQIQGRVVAEYAYNQLGLRTAATISDDSDYSIALTRIFIRHFEALGGTILLQGEIIAGQTNMRTVLGSLGSPDLLYFPVYESEGALIIAQAAEFAGLRSSALVSSDGLLSDTLVGNAGQNVVGLYISGSYIWHPGYEQFLADWEAAFGDPPSSFFHAQAYDCTNMLLDAIEVAATATPDGSLLIGRQAIRDAMAATSEFPGITGTLNCNSFGDCASGETIAIYQVSAAQLQGNWPPEAAYVSPPLSDELEYRACLVTDTGGINDASFNAIAWQGVEDAIADFGIQGVFLESTSERDYAIHISAFIEDGCDLIITVGFLLGEDTYAAADANPEVDFTLVDQGCCIDGASRLNFVGQTYKIDQAAFLAGYAAAATSQSGVVGVFGGLNIPPVTDFMDGFALGVQYYNRNNGASIEVLGWNPDTQEGLFIGSFDDADEGRLFAESLIAEGADVILPVAGPAGFGAAASALDCGCAWIIGVDSDWKARAPEYGDVILTSIIKRMNLSVYSILSSALNGEFPGGTDYVGTLENGGVGIYMDEFDAVLTQELNDLMRLIINGEIATQP